MGRKKILFGILFLLVVSLILAFAPLDQIQINPAQPSDRSKDQIVLANPTQEPQIIYVVVTATPGAESVAPVQQSQPVDAGSGQCLVQLDNGSTCTMGLEVVSEPAYASGVKVAEGEVFYKEWLVRNTGTCTWTKDYQFEFKKGWQIGSTRFNVRKDTAPGETVNVQLGMTALLPPGDQYYSTYVLKSPSGVACGEITSKYTVVSSSYYYAPTPRPGWSRPGRPDKDDPWYWYWDDDNDNWRWPWNPWPRR